MKEKRLLQFLLFFVLILTFVSFKAQAQMRNKRGVQLTKIGITQQNFSGSAYKSFAEGSAGYGLEVSMASGGPQLRYFLRGRLTYSEGRQNFLDGATEFRSKYRYTGFAPEVGLLLYPVPRRETGANIYVWGIGAVSYNYLELLTTPDGSTLKPKDQGFGSGYGGGLGFELATGGGRGSGGSSGKMLFYGEVGFRDERTNLVRQSSFELSGLTFSLGMGF